MRRISHRIARPGLPRPAPLWLIHPLRWQHVPVPWAAAARGALGAAPLLALALLAGHSGAGVMAAVGAMLAGVNDRPGTRRFGIAHIGLPACAGAIGVLLGSLLSSLGGSSWWAVPFLFVVGYFSGAVSSAGPVCSAVGTQLLVTATIGAGMPLPGAPWLKALCFLAGAGWLLLLRLLLRSPRPRGGALAGERRALADVFAALAAALDAVGGPGAEAARRRLTTALDRADEALRLYRLLCLGRRRRNEEAMLIERLAAATALCEAGVALMWEGQTLPARVASGPRLLAGALREGRPPGALPAPAADTAARRAFDQALLDAAVTFGRTRARDGAATRQHPHPRTGPDRAAVRRTAVLGPAGRDYGLRVAVCVSVGAVVALLMGAGEHWFWLPATATFLMKPDMGPLFSRVVNRCAGTALGVMIFAGLAAVGDGAGWPVAAVLVTGALIPVATRHFAFQTAVITVMVLSFLHAAGDSQAALPRLTHTAAACVLVLLTGQLLHLAVPHSRPGQRFARALRRTEEYVRHVLDGAPAGDDARRRALRRTAYRALAEARTAAETAAAEVPAGRRRAWDLVAATALAERVVDAATACAVRLEHGAPHPGREDAARTVALLAVTAAGLEHPRRSGHQGDVPAHLNEVLARLRRTGKEPAKASGRRPAGGADAEQPAR